MPPARAAPGATYPFTKKCSEKNIPLVEPDRDWFADRGIAVPRLKKDRMEI